MGEYEGCRGIFFDFLIYKNFFAMQRWLFIFGLAMAMLTVGCHHKKSAESAPSFRIEVAHAKEESLAISYEFVTHLEGGFQAVVQPRVSGYLQRSTLPVSREVKLGELLFVIDANLLSTSLRSAEAQLQSARAKEAEARSNYERAKPLAELNAISQSQMDEYRATYLSATQAVKAAEEQVRNARLQVGYASIYSPISGVAAAAAAHEGDYVGVGTQFSTLTTISNMDSLKAELSMPTSLYLRVAGARQTIHDNRGLLSNIRLWLDDGSEYEYEGVYDYTRQSISPTAGTITLVVLFPNPRATLSAGEFARIRCDVGEPRLQVLVPQQAVQSVQGESAVWVIDKDSVAHYRKVKVGATVGRDYIVEQGLQSGETVALIGSQKLRDGMKVVPVNGK